MDNFRKWLGEFALPFGVLGVCFGIITLYFGASTQVPFGWAMLVFAILVCSIYTLFCLLSDEKKEEKFTLPKVIKFIPSNYGLNYPTLLVEKNSLLGQGIAVSIYTTRDELELLLGQGAVQVIQRNGLVQVAVLAQEDGRQEIWKEIYENRTDVLKQTIIRPGHQVEI